MQSKGQCFDWIEIVKTGALAGLKPNELWGLELWEYNTVVTGYQERQKSEISNAILTGYYAAYYMNGGKRAKNPNELIKQMYTQKHPKQSFEDGLRNIERIRRLEK